MEWLWETDVQFLFLWKEPWDCQCQLTGLLTGLRWPVLMNVDGTGRKLGWWNWRLLSFLLFLSLQQACLKEDSLNVSAGMVKVECDRRKAGSALG